MINLNPSAQEPIDFFDLVVSRKEDIDLKIRLDLLRSTILELFDEYKLAFDANNLESLLKEDYLNREKEDLLSLYKYSMVAFRNLKNEVTTINTRRFTDCQNCTIDSVGSFDHILHKNNFSEFSINPLNLFPSCTKCNSKKGTRFLDDNGIRMFLNLYLDTLPNEQFLFANLDENLSPTFYLDGSNIDPDLFSIISNHYVELDLLDRFKDSSFEVVDRLVISGKTDIRDGVALNDLLRRIRDTEERFRQTYGYNYWKSILNLSLTHSAAFAAEITK
jgi:hypothetical protein